jgi:hypothetical protein
MVKPAAMPIILASAMPHWTKRSGQAFINGAILSEPARSAVKTTTLGLFLPTSKMPSPKPARVYFSFNTCMSLSMVLF